MSARLALRDAHVSILDFLRTICNGPPIFNCMLDLATCSYGAAAMVRMGDPGHREQVLQRIEGIILGSSPELVASELPLRDLHLRKAQWCIQ